MPLEIVVGWPHVGPPGGGIGGEGKGGGRGGAPHRSYTMGSASRRDERDAAIDRACGARR